MENRNHYKVQVYNLDMTTIEWEDERWYHNDLEAIVELYKQLTPDKFNIYISREIKEGVWIKVAKIY